MNLISLELQMGLTNGEGVEWLGTGLGGFLQPESFKK